MKEQSVYKKKYRTSASGDRSGYSTPEVNGANMILFKERFGLAKLWGFMLYSREPKLHQFPACKNTLVNLLILYINWRQHLKNDSINFAWVEEYVNLLLKTYDTHVFL